MRALRAQISPHFIYNSLTTIASFVRTDPERARELLLDFADFTRYSFRRHGEFTTLAEELRSIDRYLTLERARFGDQLRVTLRIAPEVLPVAVPFLCLQPLVENARPARPGDEGRGRPDHDHRRGRRGRVPDQRRGRRGRHGPRAAAPHPRRRDRRTGGTGSAWPTWTNGSARCMETSTASWWRPGPTPAPRSPCGCRSTTRGSRRLIVTERDGRVPGHLSGQILIFRVIAEEIRLADLSDHRMIDLFLHRNPVVMA